MSTANCSRRLVCIIDPLRSLNPKKDSTVAILEAAQARGWQVGVIEDGGLSWTHAQAGASNPAAANPGVQGQVQWLQVDCKQSPWWQLQGTELCALNQVDAVLMRKDPPFDAEYVNSTWLLQQAEREGARVFNRPRALLAHNEKLSIAEFASFVVPTMVSRSAQDLRAFLEEHPDAVAKPLDGMGGASVFRLQAHDPNVGVILETLTQQGRKCAMVQRYIPEIAAGDKRILLINGEPVPYALARVPKAGEHRGNLAAGGTGIAQPLSASDAHIAQTLGPILKTRGLLLVGLDVIGGNLTEVNVTSVTCFREIMEQTGFAVADVFLDALDLELQKEAPCLASW